MNGKLTVTNLKALLYYEIEQIGKDKEELEETQHEYNMLKETYNYIKTNTSMEELYSNNIMISLQLEASLKTKSDSYIDRLLSISYTLARYESQGNSQSLEYRREKENFNLFKNDLYDELEKLSFKIDSLKFKTSNAREIEHRRLLSNLKYKQLITGE